MAKIIIYALHLKQGGVESSVVNLANMLIKDFEVELVIYYNYGSVGYEIDKKVKLTYLTNYKSNKQELIFSLKSGKDLFKNVRQAVKICMERRALVKKHIESTQAEVLISTRLLYHDLVSNSTHLSVKICQEHVDHKENKKYISRVIRATKNADYLMPVSKFLAESYEKELRNRRVRPMLKYIKHAVVLPELVNYNFSKNLISVGRLSPEKGFLDLIYVLKRIVEIDPEFKLQLVGDGIESEKIKSKISELRLQNNVIMHGFLPKNKVEYELSKAGLYVLPSYEESFGLVIIESLAHGVPVVAFDSARGAVEILLDNHAGKLISNRNLDEMARWILELKSEKALEMSKYAIEFSKQYDFGTIKAETIKFIKEAIRTKHDS